MRFVPLCAIALVASVAFAPGLGGRLLTWDDDRFVTNDRLIESFSAENLGAVLGSVQFQAYHPLHLLSYMVDFALWGRWAPGYHATSLVLWILALWALYAVLRRLGVDPPAALCGTLVAGVHPLQAEVVSWISGRKDVLALGLFCAAALLAIGAERLRSRRMIGAIAVHALALLAKTSVVGLPVFLFLCDRFVLGRSTRAALARAAPFALLSVAAAIPVLAIWQEAEMIRPDPGTGTAGVLSWVGHTFLHYAGKAVWPTRLSVLYPIDRAPRLDGAALLGIGLLLSAVASLGVRRLGRARLGTGWLALSLLPVSNVVPVYFFVADRYASLTLIGAGWLVALAVQAARRPPAWARAAIAALAVVALCVASRARAAEFTSDRRLFTAAVRAQPRSYFARMKLGEVLRDAGDLAGSVRQYRAAIALEPERSLAWGGLFLAVARDDAHRQGRPDRVADRATQRYLARVGDPRGLSSLAAELRRVGMEDTSLLALDRALTLSSPSDDELAAQARQARADGFAETAELLLRHRRER